MASAAAAYLKRRPPAGERSLDVLPIRELWSSILDLFYPPHCVECRAPGTWLCLPCISRTPRVEPPICLRCGDPLDHLTSGLCPRCRNTPSQIHRVRSVYYFEGALRTAIRRFKYDGLTALAQPLGRLMADYWLTHPLSGDIIVPVPLHDDRRRNRGFNQAALLAYALSERAGLPVDDTTLVRCRATASQVGLDVEARRQNVADAFRCGSRRFADRSVLVIDDVCTTGSTLEACAVALREGGAASVHALTLARAR